MPRSAAYLPALVALALSIPPSPARADSIRVGDQILDGVYVALQGNEYQVLIPETGETLTALTARKDVKVLSTSPAAERDRIRKEWEKRKAIRQGVAEPAPTPAAAPAPVANEKPEGPKRLTQNALRESKASEELAEFETQLLLWAQLPEDLRNLMMKNVARQAHTTLEVSASKSAVLSETQQEAKTLAEEESAKLAEKTAKANADVAKNKARQNEARNQAEAKIRRAEINNDSGYYAANRDYYANKAGFDQYVGRSPSWNNYVARSYEHLRQTENAIADSAINYAASEYAARTGSLKAEERNIKQQYKAEAREANARIAALEAEKQRARTDLTVLTMNAENALAQAERQLSLMYALDDALANNYGLSLPFRQAAELHLDAHEGAGEKLIRVRGNSWRVLWGVNGPAYGSKLFSVSVIDNTTGKPAAYSTDDVSVLRRFLLLEGPGDFTIKVSGAEGSEVVVVADEVAPNS